MLTSTGLTITVILPQVLLPLIDQYFKNHTLYFLSSPSKNLSSSGYASNKEKEMVTRYTFDQLTMKTIHNHTTFKQSNTVGIKKQNILEFYSRGTDKDIFSLQISSTQNHPLKKED